jgi:hypothetical protein
MCALGIIPKSVMLERLARWAGCYEFKEETLPQERIVNWLNEYYPELGTPWDPSPDLIRGCSVYPPLPPQEGESGSVRG